MKIINQDDFSEFSTEYFNGLVRNKNEMLINGFYEFTAELHKSDMWIKNFLLNVIARDLGYELFDEEISMDMEEYNNGLYEGMAFLMLILLKCEHGEVRFNKKGYYKLSRLGLKKEYLHLNELERIWNTAFRTQSFALRDFFKRLNIYFDGL